jgi:hypothetical protein
LELSLLECSTTAASFFAIDGRINTIAEFVSGTASLEESEEGTIGSVGAASAGRTGYGKCFGEGICFGAI